MAYTYCLCLAVMNSQKVFSLINTNWRAEVTGHLQRLLNRNYNSLWILFAVVVPFMTLWLKNRNCLMQRQAIKNIHESWKLPLSLASFLTSESELRCAADILLAPLPPIVTDRCAAADAVDRMWASWRCRFRDLFTIMLYTIYMLLDFCNAVYNEAWTLTKSSKNDAVFCNSP